MNAVEMPPVMSIEEAVGLTQTFVQQYLKLCFAIRDKGFESVEFHEKFLGKPERRMRLEFLFSIWTFKTSTVPLTLFVANVKGICLEVPLGTSKWKARRAWGEYRRAVYKFLRKR